MSTTNCVTLFSRSEVFTAQKKGAFAAASFAALTAIVIGILGALNIIQMPPSALYGVFGAGIALIISQGIFFFIFYQQAVRLDRALNTYQTVE